MKTRISKSERTEIRERIRELAADMKKYPSMAGSIAQDVARLQNELATR